MSMKLIFKNRYSQGPARRNLIRQTLSGIFPALPSCGNAAVF